MQVKTALSFLFTLLGQNGYHKENKKQQMLARLQGEGKLTFIHCW
jgi:hypothetical protein